MSNEIIILLVLLCILFTYNKTNSLYSYHSKALLRKNHNIYTQLQPQPQQEPHNHFYEKSKYLTAVQWKHINIILTNNSSSYELKKKVKNIIYSYYEDWAFSNVHHIKKKYYYMSQDIELDELKLYAYIGLRKAIINYDINCINNNTIHNFPNYAYKYVHNEIVNGISELLPMYLHYQEEKHLHLHNKHYKRTKRSTKYIKK
jgi:hypothetical protein